MATKATIKNISDDFGSITGTLSKGSISDDRTPALSGRLSKKLGKKESLLIFSDGVEIGEANVKGRNWNFEPISDLEDTSYNFQAIVSKGGKLGNASKPYQILFDTKAPTFDITGHSESVVNDDVTFKFNFSEDVLDFKASDIKVTGGSKGKFSGSGDTYKLVVSPNSNDEGTIIIKTNAGIASDLAGNKNTKNLSVQQEFDTKSPTIDITGHSENVISGDVTFKFNFSEDVIGFKAGDIKVSGGSKGKFSGSGDTYKLVVSPNSNEEGSLAISVGKEAFADSVDNKNKKQTDVLQKYDTRISPIAKNFVVPSEAQLEDTVIEELNFGSIYSELVKVKDYPNGDTSFTADNFEIVNVSIDGGNTLSAEDAGITVDRNGFIKIDTRVEAYQYLNDGDLVDVVTKFLVTANNGLSDTGKVFFQVAGVNEHNSDEPSEQSGPIAKDFVAPISPQPEDTVTTNLNFGQIYSELVKAKYYPDGTFTSDSFEIKNVSIDGLDAISASEAGITVSSNGFIKIDTRVDAYQYLGDGDVVDVVVKFKVTDNNGLYDFGNVTFGVAGIDNDEISGPIAKDFVAPISQPEDTVVKDLNFGEIYSELVKARLYPDGTFTSDSFEIINVSIDRKDPITAAEAGITVKGDGLIKVDTRVDAYQYLDDSDTVDVVTMFKVTDHQGLYDFGTVTFQVVGISNDIF